MNFDQGALAVVTLGGQARTIDLPGPLAGEPDLDDKRIVFSTRGCSADTGGVWVDDGTDNSVVPAPPPPQCSVRLSSARSPSAATAGSTCP